MATPIKPESIIAIGIGGTGAKCIESLVHLAASGHTPQNIIPILIDQDNKNGNVHRCKNVIQSYSSLQKKLSGSRSWFFRPTINDYDELLPLLPQKETLNFGAAIGFPSMKEYERDVVKALYLQSQLNENLDVGYKKRAHMGSLLMQQMIERETEKAENIVGLNFIISKLKPVQKPLVVIYGSLFGGTGASGMTRIGKHFKDKMPNALVRAVFLTPYFIIGEGSEKDTDANLVKSDSDMQAVKAVLQIYKDEIFNSFHSVYVVGSEISKLDGEYISKEAKYGGAEQKNPSHIFELLTATIPIKEIEDESNKMHSFIAETEQLEIPLRFALNSRYPRKGQYDFNAILSEAKLNPLRMLIAKDFANMLSVVKNNDDKKWWKRQPWADTSFKTDLINWGERHAEWWKEISPITYNGHIWKKFSLQLDTQIDTYSYSAYISRYFKKDPSDLSNLYETINALDKVNIRRVRWASI